MGKSLREKFNQLPQDRQDRIRQQAEQWIAEDPVLQDLRSAAHNDLHHNDLNPVMLQKMILELNFRDQTSADRQEKFTQRMFQQLQAVPGLKVDRVAELAPDGSRSSGRFLWGLLQAEVGIPGVKNLFGFLGDRLGDKPIVIKAKFADGRVFDVTASSRAELDAAREMLEAMAKIQ
jgi:hypothetical protein